MKPYPDPRLNRSEALAKVLYDYLFSLLDSEPDLTGEDAGRIATRAAAAFRAAYQEDPE